jgi:hypothetical protein
MRGSVKEHEMLVGNNYVGFNGMQQVLIPPGLIGR